MRPLGEGWEEGHREAPPFPHARPSPQTSLQRGEGASLNEGLIVCGGAIGDFLAGKTPRALDWLQRHGLELLWRLDQEPWPLF